MPKGKIIYLDDLRRRQSPPSQDLLSDNGQWLLGMLREVGVITDNSDGECLEQALIETGIVK